ncbi:MAG UNVERIFIED_CONTAM: hypothetical protein LVR18_35135 [Planctomycetaceae bacterium]
MEVSFHWKLPYRASVTVTLPAGAFQDSDGNVSIAATESITVAGPTMRLMSAAADMAALNAAGYVDVVVAGSGAGPVTESFSDGLGPGIQRHGGGRDRSDLQRGGRTSEWFRHLSLPLHRNLLVRESAV